MNYHKVAVGGTFDHFHNGHKALLDKAFEIGEKVVVGVTSDKFTSSKYLVASIKYKKTDENPLLLTTNYLLQSQQERIAQVKKYLEDKDFIERVKLIVIDDSYGPTISDSSFDAIVVSPETEKTAHEINQKRVAHKLPLLTIILVPWVVAEDGEPIHSTRIRAGEINREGKVFAVPENWGKRKITEELRQELKRPLEEFIQGNSDKPEEAIATFSSKYQEVSSKYYSLLTTRYLVTVGDEVTHSFLSGGITPWASIIDYHVERKRRYENVGELGFPSGVPVMVARNPAGTLSYEVFTAMRELFQNPKSPKVLAIEGEEDLTVLFAILLLPLDSLVIYGQPRSAHYVRERAAARSVFIPERASSFSQGGIVVVEVTEAMKEKTMGYLSQFTLSV